MATEEKLNITPVLTANKDGENVLVIRHDNPKKDPDPEVVTLDGIITSPSEFVKKRGELVDPLNSHVVFSKTELKIELTVNENSKFKSTIVGTMKDNPLLQQLKINKGHGFTLGQLKKILQYERSNFKDPDRHRALMVMLENFKVKVDKTIEVFNNRENKTKGASVKLEIAKETTDFNLNFTLLVPFFVGGNEKSEIPLEVFVEPGEQGVEVYVEWDQYEKEREAKIDTLWTDEMQFFEKFVIIEKS